MNVSLEPLFRETEVMTYPCPECGTYNKPYMHTKDGYAYMLCKNCKVQYKTSTKVSANFRKFCSKIASKPNKSQSYYTSLELKVKRILLKLGYREGIDFIHNCMIPNGKVKYYVDFYLPKESLVIECSPSIWHNMWNREESDRRKMEFLMSEGLNVLEVDEKSYRNVESVLNRRVE